MLSKNIFLLILFYLLILNNTYIAADNNLERGLRAYSQELWDEAINELVEASNEDPYNDLIYLYLGFSYQILGYYEQAEKVMIYGVNLGGENATRIAFTLGNLYYNQQQYKKSADAFGLAVKGPELIVEAYLNRANLNIVTENFSAAIADYETFIKLKPFANERSAVENMLRALKNDGLSKDITLPGSSALAPPYIQSGSVQAQSAPQNQSSTPASSSGNNQSSKRQGSSSQAQNDPQNQSATPASSSGNSQSSNEQDPSSQAQNDQKTSAYFGSSSDDIPNSYESDASDRTKQRIEQSFESIQDNSRILDPENSPGVENDFKLSKIED